MLAYYAPEEAGFAEDRLQLVYHQLEQAAASGAIPGAALLVARAGRAVAPFAVGRQIPDEPESKVSPESIFLVASVTKPVVAAALLLLVERGKLLISDRVADLLPEFGNHGKEAVRVHHLLTHTSGLPDMLPENTELRRQHAPLSEFVRRICELELDFAPGTRIQYQSAGIALLGEIVERISGMALPAFLRQEFFIPLRMADSSLGVGDLDQSRIVHVNLPEEMRDADLGLESTRSVEFWRTVGWHVYDSKRPLPLLPDVSEWGQVGWRLHPLTRHGDRHDHGSIDGDCKGTSRQPRRYVLGADLGLGLDNCGAACARWWAHLLW